MSDVQEFIHMHLVIVSTLPELEIEFEHLILSLLKKQVEFVDILNLKTGVILEAAHECCCLLWEPPLTELVQLSN